MAAFLAYQATSLIRELPQTPAATARRHSCAMESCRTASTSVMSIWRGGRNLRPPPTAHPSQTLGKHSNDIFICSVGIQTPSHAETACRKTLPTTSNRLPHQIPATSPPPDCSRVRLFSPAPHRPDAAWCARTTVPSSPPARRSTACREAHRFPACRCFRISK